MGAKVLVYAGLVFLFASKVYAEPQSAEKCIQRNESERTWSPFVQGQVAYGRTSGTTVEESDIGYVGGLEFGARRSLTMDLCLSLSAKIFTATAKFKDRDNHADATLDIMQGVLLGVGGRYPITQDWSAEGSAGLGAANTTYSSDARDVEYDKTAPWGGRVGEITAGLGLNLTDVTQVRLGLSITHVVTGAGRQRGNEGDGAASVASNDTGKAVNLNIIGAYIGVGVEL